MRSNSLEVLRHTLPLVTALGTLGACAIDELDTSATTQASTNWAVTMSNLGPVGWWRLGETTGTAADSSGKGHTGTFLNFTSGRGVSGAIVGDSNGAVQITPVTNSCTSSPSPYVEVSDSDDFSLTKGQDSFDRADSGSYWGVADHGGTWSAEVSTTESYYSITSNHAAIAQSTTGTWQMGLPISRKDVDLQVQASWNQHAAGAATMPVALVARRTDNSNYYRAEIRELLTGQVEVRIEKAVAPNPATPIGTSAIVGTYTTNDWWYLRFQVEGTSLRARAWKAGTTEPTTWQATATDSSLTAAGNVSIRSANSGSTVNPTVLFDDFRVQSVGMTVHAFMKPTVTEFNGGNYVHFLGKGINPNMEWAFRYYPASDGSFPNRVSGYIWKPTCVGCSNLGAGASFDSASTANVWYEIVVVYDPGDKLDQNAGVTMYENGACATGVGCGDTGIWLKYSNPDYVVVPMNGTSPLRIGTRDCASFFTGVLDEVAVFDRKLTSTEISNLRTASQ
jgi:hypothetical protein